MALDRIARADLNVERIQIELMGNIGVVLLRLKTVLREYAAFECS